MYALLHKIRTHTYAILACNRSIVQSYLHLSCSMFIM